MSLSRHSKPCGVKSVVYRAYLKQTSLRVPKLVYNVFMPFQDTFGTLTACIR
jgi:hypothetical protein